MAEPARYSHDHPHRRTPGGLPESVELIELIETQLLGRPLSLRPTEVSEATSVSMERAQRMWRALGFPVIEGEDVMFAEADVEAMRHVTELMHKGGIDEDLAVGMTRALARTADRLAVWQTQLVAESLTPTEQVAGPGEDKDSRHVADPAVAEAAARLLTGLAGEIEPLLTYVWRRHLSGAIARMLADADNADDASAPQRVVGFADLVSFTALVRRMTERQLGVLVQRFEELASDIVTAHGGRVIKTVGDEILFVHSDVAPAAAIALDLTDAMAEDSLLPHVRVGMAYGTCVSRLGDVFGLTVNRASRLTAVTPDGRVFVDDVLARRLSTVSGFTATAQRRRHLRGIGLVTPSELRRASVGRREAT